MLTQLLPRNVEAVRSVLVPLIAAAAIGDAGTLALLVAKIAGADVSWLLVVTPFLLGLLCMAALLYYSRSISREMEEIEEARAYRDICERRDMEEDWNAISSSSTEDRESTQG